MPTDTHRSSSPFAPLCIRLMDILLSVTFLFLLSPLIAIIMIAIKLDDGGPVFFIRQRPGLNGNPFPMYKFRSMTVGAENKGAGAFIQGEEDSRITPAGRILRKTSLDELPQLLNVLKGEMSLVGPRPGMFFHLEQYDRRQMLRLTVKPGITGWAQINGRNSLSWPERIEHDIWYIKNRSVYLYLKIIALTLPSLFKTEGVYAEREKFLFGDGDTEKSEYAGSSVSGQKLDESISSVK